MTYYYHDILNLWSLKDQDVDVSINAIPLDLLMFHWNLYKKQLKNFY